MSEMGSLSLTETYLLAMSCRRTCAAGRCLRDLGFRSKSLDFHHEADDGILPTLSWQPMWESESDEKKNQVVIIDLQENAGEK
jgi:hypothetical protein